MWRIRVERCCSELPTSSESMRLIVTNYHHPVLPLLPSMDTLPNELLQRITEEIHLSMCADKTFRGETYQLPDESDTVRLRWANVHMATICSTSWRFRRLGFGALFSIVDIHCPGCFADKDVMKYVVARIDSLPDHRLEVIRSVGKQPFDILFD